MIEVSDLGPSKYAYVDREGASDRRSRNPQPRGLCLKSLATLEKYKYNAQ